MADNLKTLIRMANQIAAFHRPYGGDTAIEGVRSHIFRFWSPVMRQDLHKHIQSGGAGVEQEVLGAFRKMEEAGQIGPQRKAG